MEPSGQELYIAETFCPRAAARVDAARSTRSSRTTTSRMVADRQARLPSAGEYGYAFFED